MRRETKEALKAEALLREKLQPIVDAWIAKCYSDLIIHGEGHIGYTYEDIKKELDRTC